MPIVFAIQDPQSAALLDLSLSCGIRLLDACHNDQSLHPSIRSIDNLHFLRSSTSLATTPSSDITVPISSTPRTARNRYPVQSCEVPDQGEQQPDLVAAAEHGTCENTQGHVSNSTRTFPAPNHRKTTVASPRVQSCRLHRLCPLRIPVRSR